MENNIHQSTGFDSLRNLTRAVLGRGGVGLLLIGAAAAQVPTEAPFHEPFGSHAPGPLVTAGSPWSVDAPGLGSEVRIESTGPGQRVCQVYNSDLSLHVDAAADATNTWTHLRIYPQPHSAASEPALPDTTHSIAFYVNSDGYLRALDGNIWNTVGSVPLDQWLVIAIHSDYQNRTWDLYLSASPAPGSRLVKQNASPLAFRTGSSQPRLQEVVVSGASGLDDVAIAHEDKPVDAGSHDRVMMMAATLQAGMQKTIGLLPYGYAAGQDDLAGGLGTDLYKALEDNDTVVIHDTSIHAYIRDSGLPGGWDDTGKNGLELADARIRPGTGVFVTKAITGPFVFFADYDAIPPSEPRPLLGRAQGGFGLNLLAWDQDLPSQPAGTHGLGFAGQAGAGDKLYIPDPDQGPFATKLLYWDATNNRWMNSGTVATDQLRPGAAFWYVRRASGDATWDIGAAE